MITTQFEDNFLICFFDDNIPVLSHRWKGFVDAENFKKSLLKLIDLFISLKVEYPSISWLGDTTKLGALNLETQKWLKDTWPEIMKSAGVKKHALIIPINLFAKIAMDKFVGNMATNQTGVMVRYFTEEKEANMWLKEVN